MNSRVRSAIKPNESLDELFIRSKIIRDGPEFKKLLDFLSKFKKYSIYNNLLVFIQNPNCQYYATAKDWKKRFERWPKQAARPLVILAPMHPVLFVYDLDDTEGKPIPNMAGDPFGVKGEFKQVYLDRLLDWTRKSGITVAIRALDFRHGGSIRRESDNLEIELNLKHESRMHFATLVHELGHLMLGHLGTQSNEGWPLRVSQLLNDKGAKEIEAESVAYLVLLRLGLENRAAEYLAFYNGNPKSLERISLDLIIKVASKIESLAKG